ncbi:MAG TPA: low molecular weight phosphotyrosine protein phosphatase [Flavobacteriales bacterium]|nr:low molecular weight phosphotyrosine protein phosphatase [Flavobacteriales bacterium]HIN39959.1 low molecular weight phosphotyrosine protein phosphatase [Flavobacteriales bacterium]
MKVLMVCLGNICRSPLAEGLLREKVQKRGLNVEVDSCGTAAYHVGEAPDSRMILTAHSHGIDISTLMGRQFTVNDFDEFDQIFAMDSSNYHNIISLARNDADIDKVSFLLDQIKPGENMSVPDPWYGGDKGFEKVYELIDTACENIAKNL